MLISWPLSYLHGQGVAPSVDYSLAYSGATQEYVIPPGVTLFAFRMWGGAGSGGSYSGGGGTLRGGGGGYTKGELSVTSGDIIRVQVGQGGQYASGGGGAGGWPDGGGGASGDTRGGGGGGSSRIWKNGTLMAVAGGGGGCAAFDGGGGAGGGSSGTASSSSSGGEGGSQVVGGRDHNDTGNTTKTGLQISTETNRTGGWGSTTGDTTTSTSDDGGGGGGGYWGGGGGGGDGQAGGGGSGYLSGSVSNGTTTAGSTSATAGTTDPKYPGSPVGVGSQSGTNTIVGTAGGNGYAWVAVNPLPINTVLPAITGSPNVSSVLTAGTGTWDYSPTFTYQWKLDAVNISGQTASTYTVQAGDLGKTLTCVVTGTNAGGVATATTAGVVVSNIRGSRIAFVNASSSGVITLPSGSVAGDLCVIATGHAWNASTPSGWTSIDNLTGSFANGAAFQKILSSGDISTGTVTIGYGGSQNGVIAAITFVSATTYRTAASQRNSSGASSRTVTTSSAPVAGDLIMYFSFGRFNGAVTSSAGSQIQTTSNSEASGVLALSTLGSSGAVSSTFSFNSTPSGDYEIIIAVS